MRMKKKKQLIPCASLHFRAVDRQPPVLDHWEVVLLLGTPRNCWVLVLRHGAMPSLTSPPFSFLLLHKEGIISLLLDHSVPVAHFLHWIVGSQRATWRYGAALPNEIPWVLQLSGCLPLRKTFSHLSSTQETWSTTSYHTVIPANWFIHICSLWKQAHTF